MIFDVDKIPIPILVMDKQGLLLDCNQAVEKIYGYNKEEFLSPVPDLLALNDEESCKLRDLLAETVIDGDERRLFTKHRTASNEVIAVDLVAKKIDFGQSDAIMVCVRECTEQECVQEQLLQKVGQLQQVTESLAQKNEHLEHLANLDPLTGIYNRLYFNTRLESEIARAKRYKEPLTLLMIDVDHFKSINDQYGHLVGDQVLVTVADKLKADLRRSDVLVRFGGEEFAIIAPNTSLQGGRFLAHLTQARVKETHVCSFAEGTEVTVSIGIATIDFAQTDIEVDAAKYALVKTADDKLYQAKNAGRNLIEY